MKLLKGLYWNVYYELREKGKSTASVRSTGTLLVALALLLNAFVILILWNAVWPEVGEFIDDLLKDLFGRRQGRVIGKFVGAASLGFFYAIAWLAWGREQGYRGLIEEFNRLTDHEQRAASNASLPYFIGSIGLFFLVLLLFLFGVL